MRGRLIIDEMFPRDLSTRLTKAGHDAVSVHDEGPGKPDAAVWEIAVTQRRGLLTENAADFRPLLADAVNNQRPVVPLLIVHRSRFPRGKALPAALARHVNDFLASRGDLPSTEWWL